jgi:glyoxylase-like metal-dependent hydrolase (beta-lactamase superfamily II)
MSYTIRALVSGEQGGVPGPEVYYQSHFADYYTLYFYIWLIQGEGRTIIVDTGMAPDSDAMTARTQRNKTPLSYWRTFKTAEVLLAEAGVKPEEVQDVVISALGGYAMAGVALFTNARYHISREGWCEYFAPTPPWPRRQPNTYLKWLLNEALDRVDLIDEEAEIAPGILAHHTGGHHRGSLAVAVETAKGKAIIVDTAFLYGNIEGGPVLGITHALYDVYKAYDWVRGEADIILPGHDPAVLERHPGGLIG